ncbi:SANT and BTB domain regulator of CSR, BTB domain [Popillia japonica]|uniref:SANT and BTB domain regulator of CSR, BTB domain n=1 Tax=Popillia japonica TaxID=7064 RepID=A0AAW1JBP5_POPJA
MEASEGTVSDKKETEKISQRKTNSCIIKKSDHPPKFKEDTSKGSEITIKEFLDFLKTAYQVQDNIEGILRSEGLTDIVDWLELKENSLVKPNEIAVQTSDPKVKQDDKKEKKRSDSNEQENGEIKRKLSEVLSEGILDSVLPYLVPVNTTISQRRMSTGKMQDRALLSADERVVRRKSLDSGINTKLPVSKFDSEVEIHVCDEVKNVKKDFTCNQKLLVEQMGYFADVTAGQRLEDMDISVHCDIGIFEWLMRWVKRDTILEGDRPVLDINCAVPVLVSAAFLQMEPLLEECLLFCHENMNDILKTTTSLSCLNDAVLTRLAAMYTNAEVEAIKDRKDKIQSKLFCKLIQSLCESEPESLRGHFATMGRIFKCRFCQQLVSPLIADFLPCLPCCTTLELDGVMTSRHVRDSNWNLTEYVANLQNQLKTWRKVYWRMWGDTHFLYCLTCKKYFPAKQIGWCRFHPDPPQYFTLDAQRAPLPVGRYPCCGERAYRFQLLSDYSGCKFKDHEICTKETRDASISAMLEMYRSLIEETPPELMFPERLTRLVAKDPGNDEDGALECKEDMWWEGIEIIPPRPKLGLLGVFDDSDDVESEIDDVPDDTFSSDDDVKVPLKRKKLKKRNCRLWQHNMSARSNQDIQRAYEEIALKDMLSILNRRTIASAGVHNSKPSKAFSRHITPPGGVWVRLESEWRDANSGISNQKSRGYGIRARSRK